ncbi:MAG: phosphopantetheine-binding protein [Sphingomonas sp.]
MSDMALQTDGGRAARAALEAAIGAIWVETLELPEIEVNDDFFELGGHSLIAIEITEKIRALLGANKFPIDLFETPTIATLTDAILARLNAGTVA